MRKVVAAEFLSLDGVMESPDKWHFPYFNEEMGQAVGEGFAAADAIRDSLTALGVEVSDTPQGPRWKVRHAGQ